MEGAWGGPAPPYFSSKLRSEGPTKIFLETGPPPPPSQGRDDSPPPPPSEELDPPLGWVGGFGDLNPKLPS